MKNGLAWILISASCGFAQAPNDPFLHWMDGIAQRHLQQRAQAIAAIRTTAEADARRREVRGKILQLIGGLPNYAGPLKPRVTGTLPMKGYEIRKLIFESLPGILVTANYYVPDGRGSHPGILLPLGHWDRGKSAVQVIAGNLALRGFAVLTYDPLGQGERLQAFDPRTGKSLAGGSTEQHFLAGAQSLLVGQSFARYRIWDAKRALDLLVSQPEVDPSRIGVTGCSGGGTLTTYISALDDRVKVAAPACYMNSFVTLFSGAIGDSEQSIPGFLSSGLDQADYVELFAPKPWLISTTEQDFFTPAGSRQVYEEARKWYSLWGAEEKIQWIEGPGEHGTPLKIRQAIYNWMEQWLMPGVAHRPEFDIDQRPDFAFRATASGQVAGEASSRDIYLVIKEQIPNSNGALMAELRRMVDEAKKDAPVPVVNVTHTGSASRRGVVFVGQGPMLDTLSKQFVVADLQLSGIQRPRPRNYSGEWMPATRMLLVGRSLAILHAAQILASVDQLRKDPAVDPGQVAVAARGVAGIPALIAAALDPGISRIWLDQTPVSFRSAFQSPLSDDMYRVAIPGILKWGDLPDLADSIGPRRLVWTDPFDWMQNLIAVDAPYVRYRTADDVVNYADLPKGF